MTDTFIIIYPMRVIVKRLKSIKKLRPKYGRLQPSGGYLIINGYPTIYADSGISSPALSCSCRMIYTT